MALSSALETRPIVTYLQGLCVFMDLAPFGVEFHCIREDELHVLRKIGTRMIFLPLQFFLTQTVKLGRTLVGGKRVQKCFRSIGVS